MTYNIYNGMNLSPPPTLVYENCVFHPKSRLASLKVRLCVHVIHLRPSHAMLKTLGLKWPTRSVLGQ